MKIKSIKTVLTVALLSSLLINMVIGTEEVTPEVLTLTVYFDGFVLVDYELKVNPSYPVVNISLIGGNIEDLLIVDEKGFPLDHTFLNGEIEVYTLGAKEIEMTYFTPDLTSKVGKNWTLHVNAPINTTIILPIDASIIDLNTVPEMIESENNQITLVMPAGLIEVIFSAYKRLNQSFLNYEQLIVILASIMVIIFLILIYRKKRSSIQKSEKIRPEVNFEKILRRHKDLRVEERQAIRVLVEKGGRALEAELFEKLSLPRTTTWRLVKRLENMGIVQITKSRRQNIISIKKKYFFEKK